MECVEAARLITYFCDSRPDPRDEEKLYRHLRRCSRCKGFVHGVEEQLRVTGCELDSVKAKGEVLEVVSKIVKNFY